MSNHRDHLKSPDHEHSFSQQGQQDQRSLSAQIHQTQQQLAQLHSLVHSGGFQAQQPLRRGSFPQPQRLGSNPAVPPEGKSPAWVTGDTQLLRLVQSASLGVQDRWQPGSDNTDSTLSAARSTMGSGPGAPIRSTQFCLPPSLHPGEILSSPRASQTGSLGHQVHPHMALGLQQPTPQAQDAIASSFYLPLTAQDCSASYPQQKTSHVRQHEQHEVGQAAVGEGVMPSNTASHSSSLNFEHSAAGIHARLPSSLPPRAPAPPSPLHLFPTVHNTSLLLGPPLAMRGEEASLLNKRRTPEMDDNALGRQLGFAGGGGVCEHGSLWGQCRPCAVAAGGQGAFAEEAGAGGKKAKGALCVHGLQRSGCRACGGSQMCEHGRQRSRCRDCGGSGVCEHQRQRGTCKECGGSQICEHHRRRSLCKDCGGSQICAHNRQRSYCKDCKGSGVCEHNRRRSSCKDCGGSGICIHRRLRRQCKECGGSSICEHSRQRSLCKECGGSQICQHNKRRKQCRECAAATASQVGELTSISETQGGTRAGCSGSNLKASGQGRA